RPALPPHAIRRCRRNRHEYALRVRLPSPSSKIRLRRPGSGKYSLGRRKEPSSFALLKVQCRRIAAVAAARGFGAIVKNVTQMRPAGFAKHLGAGHAMRVVVPVFDGIFWALSNRLKVARPAGAGLEFSGGIEKRGSTTHAIVNSVGFVTM